MFMLVGMMGTFDPFIGHAQSRFCNKSDLVLGKEFSHVFFANSFGEPRKFQVDSEKSGALEISGLWNLAHLAHCSLSFSKVRNFFLTLHPKISGHCQNILAQSENSSCAIFWQKF